MKCTKAIIALAGYGGRRVPITKAIEKCMIPIGNRPIVDYIVDDCIAAGITDIIFVVGEQSHQIRTYYGHNQGLEDYLVKHHKLDALDSISDLKTKARFHFVLQDSKQPYGTTVPLWMARDYIREDEDFLYLYGDNIFYREEGGSTIAEFLKDAEATGAQAAMMVNEVPHEMVSNYGVVAAEERDGHEFFKYIHEKPTKEEAPSNFNNSGCFKLNSAIFEHVERGMTHPGKEQFFTDPLNWFHDDGNDIAVIRMKAEWLDCGSVEGWLYANNRVVNSKTASPESSTLV
jgi:UTP--glucose-1-phosphate uridylyltransferase